MVWILLLPVWLAGAVVVAAAAVAGIVLMPVLFLLRLVFWLPLLLVKGVFRVTAALLFLPFALLLFALALLPVIFPLAVLACAVWAVVRLTRRSSSRPPSIPAVFQV